MSTTDAQPWLGRRPADSVSRVSYVLRILGCVTVVCCSLLAPTAATAEGWVVPLAGQPDVTRPFDPPSTPYGSGHRGVDLAGTPGQSVRAAGGGVIGYAAPLAGRGVVTVLHSGGLRTTYEPVTATVTVGESVQPGDPIGTLQAGHRGCPAAACLHWGLLQGEVYLDPMSLLSPGPLRLLPTGSQVPVGPARNPVPAAETAVGDLSPARRDAARSDGEDPATPWIPPGVAVLAGVSAGVAILLVRPRPP